MVSVGQDLNPVADPNSIKPLMGDVIDLEKRIAKITVPETERQDIQKMYSQLSIADLNKRAGFVSDSFKIFLAARF